MVFSALIIASKVACLPAVGDVEPSERSKAPLYAPISVFENVSVRRSVPAVDAS